MARASHIKKLAIFLKGLKVKRGGAENFNGYIEIPLRASASPRLRVFLGLLRSAAVSAAFKIYCEPHNRF